MELRECKIGTHVVIDFNTSDSPAVIDFNTSDSQINTFAILLAFVIIYLIKLLK